MPEELTETVETLPAEAEGTVSAVELNPVDDVIAAGEIGSEAVAEDKE